ncbi:hypothetical protein ACN20G_37135 (plasmid) [Streptomyces sp. BI20]|uniref:hypothetical protein n=1 Tax=Streptomyces sp. BI20 TaxID=3403460 RepID=UPI003C73A925
MSTLPSTPSRPGRHRRSPEPAVPLPGPGERLSDTAWWWQGLGGAKAQWEDTFGGEMPRPQNVLYICQADGPGVDPVLGCCGAAGAPRPLAPSTVILAEDWQELVEHVAREHPGRDVQEVGMLSVEWVYDTDAGPSGRRPLGIPVADWPAEYTRRRREWAAARGHRPRLRTVPTADDLAEADADAGAGAGVEGGEVKG